VAGGVYPLPDAESAEESEYGAAGVEASVPETEGGV
jgi:hypothetical protein